MLLDPNEAGRGPKTEFGAKTLGAKAALDARTALGARVEPNVWAVLCERMPPEMMAASVSPARRVRALREWQGLSQVDLADLSGLAETQIARAERGCDTSPAVWRALARALHVGEALIRRGADHGPGF